jgi:hypothetical protein
MNMMHSSLYTIINGDRGLCERIPLVRATFHAVFRLQRMLPHPMVDVRLKAFSGS